MSGGRTCLIGLDGMPCGLLRRLAEAGVMPRVAERIAAGHLREMRASLPEISSVSWSSFMTGAGPGTHGVFGFTDLKPDSYELRFPSFEDVDVPTLWDRLGRAGVTSVVLNQPATYPARSIPGVLVSGFVAVDLTRSVRPIKFLGPLSRMGYRVDIDVVGCRRDHDALFRELHETLELRRRALWHLWDEVRWGFLQVVITGTDRLYHFLFDALDDPEHPRHDQALDYHRAVDDLVGAVWDRFAAEEGDAAGERFWMLSDHGFCAIRQEVQINAWLRRQGWLTLEAGATDLASIGPESDAFALDPGRIYVHRRDRFPRGGVEPGDAPRIAAAIRDRLRGLRYDGQPVIREVLDGGQIYEGPHVAEGPDLVALSHPGFDLKASSAASEIFDRSDLVGMHTYDDAFLLSPRPIRGDLWIGDIAGHLMQELA